MRADHAKSNPYRALPAAAEHVWRWFQELDGARTDNGYGANPIGFADLSAWSNVTGRQPREWEVAALRAMDAEKLSLLYGEAPKGEAAEAPTVSERPMSAGLFDALFA